VPPGDAKALPRVVEALFAFMQRNASHLTDYFPIASGTGRRDRQAGGDLTSSDRLANR